MKTSPFHNRTALLPSARIQGRSDAIFTGVSQKGTWVRPLQPPVAGRLDRGFRRPDVVHRVRARLVRADVERGFIDFARN